MGIEIIPIGGYNKVEGNSTAIKVDDEVVILDMGLTMDNFIIRTLENLFKKRDRLD